MIINNKFLIKSIKNIVFFGYSEKIFELIEINKNLNLKSSVITTSDQANLIDSRIKKKVFNNIDNNFTNFISKNFDIKSTLFISMGARYIFTKKIINDLFLNNLINFHHSRLPLDAGGGGYTWRILREDRIDNQLVHLVDEGIDSGPIIESLASIYPSYCKVPIDFENYKLERFLEFYKKIILKIVSGKTFPLKIQANYFGRYNPRLSSDKDGHIDWNLDSRDLYNFINAFDEPYSGANTYLNNGDFGKLYIKKAHLHGGDFSNHPYLSGIVSRHDKNWIVVNTSGKHVLLLEEVLDKNGKNILSKIKVGDRFYTKVSELEKS